MLLALAVVIVHAFRPVVIRLYVAYLFCLFFSKKFNIMSALFAHQLPIACKYSILARVYFDVSNTKFGYAKQIVFLYKNNDLYQKTSLLY